LEREQMRRREAEGKEGDRSSGTKDKHTSNC